MAKVANDTLTYTTNEDRRIDALWVDDQTTDTRSVNREEGLAKSFFNAGSTASGGAEKAYLSRIQQLLRSGRYTETTVPTELEAGSETAVDICSQIAALTAPTAWFTDPLQWAGYGGATAASSLTVTRAAATNSGLTLVPDNWANYYNNLAVVFTSVAANIKRGSGLRQRQGILCEPARTNLVLNNGGDTTTNWAAAGGAPVPSFAVVTPPVPPPYGTQAIRVTANGGTNPIVRQSSIATSDLTEYTATIYVYVPTTSFVGSIRLVIYKTGGGLLTSSTITDRDAWVRSTITFTPAATDSPVMLGMDSSGTELADTILGYFQLAQVEAGPNASTPIVVGGTASQRQIDQISLTFGAGHLLAADGTIIAWCPETPDLGAQQNLVTLTGATGSTSLRWSSVDGLGGAYNGTALNIAAMNHALAHHVGMTWADAGGGNVSARLYRNGALAVGPTSIAVNATLGTTMTLGASAAGATPLGAPVMVWCWPYALSAGEILTHFNETDRGGTT